MPLDKKLFGRDLFDGLNREEEVQSEKSFEVKKKSWS
jgi:hypothetical protein